MILFHNLLYTAAYISFVCFLWFIKITILENLTVMEAEEKMTLTLVDENVQQVFISPRQLVYPQSN